MKFRTVKFLCFLILSIELGKSEESLGASLWNVAEDALKINNIHKTGLGLSSSLGDSGFAMCPRTAGNSDLLFGYASRHLSANAEHIENLHSASLEKSNKMNQKLLEMDTDVQQSETFRELNKNIEQIDEDHRELMELIGDPQFKPRSLCTKASYQLMNDEVADTEKIHQLIMSTSTTPPNIMSLLEQTFEEHTLTLCSTGHAPNEYMYSLYHSLMMTELKAYTIQVHYHHLLSRLNGTGDDTDDQCVYKLGDVTEQTNLLMKKMTDHIADYARIFIEKMAKIPKGFRACDEGADFRRDITFIELEGLIQTIVYPPHEFLLADKIASINDLRCHDLDNAVGIPPEFCHKNLDMCVVPRRPCSGRSYDCERTNFVKGCLADAGSRRFKWLKFNKKHVSSDLECGEQALMTIDTRRSCVCKCNDNAPTSISTHIISLQPVVADIEKNMVVIGVRFVKRKEVIYLQIKQGKLLPNFRIEPEEDWKPIHDINDEIREARLNRRVPGTRGLLENQDYLVITVGVNNAVNMDAIELPYDFVLTGVRFSRSPVGRIEIVALGTEFDQAPGNLTSPDFQQFRSPIDDNRDAFAYGTTEPFQPEFPMLPNAIDSRTYVTIGMSDKMTDGGQTTVPFFDAIPVESQPPTPLGGISIFMRGATNSFPGLFSLGLHSLPYQKYIENSIQSFPVMAKVSDQIG